MYFLAGPVYCRGPRSLRLCSRRIVVNGDLTLRRTFQLDQKPFEPPAITLYLQQTMFQQYNTNRGGLGIVVHFCIIARVSLSVCFDIGYFKVTVAN